MLPKVRYGKTELQVTRIGLGGYPFGGVNLARGWNPFTAEGRMTAIRTIHAALDAGINYLDTAPGYGDGNSESIIGEATQGRREQFILATKVAYAGITAAQVTASVEASLRRLRTEYLDIVQFHGGAYEASDIEHILTDGLLDALLALREKGFLRYIGFTTEEPWSARPLIACGQFDMCQLCYNLIYQSAALHALNEARQHDLGVAVMRPFTSGIFQRLASILAPEWQQAHDLYEVALKFLLSDSRVHVANLGMRWPEEVLTNVAIAEAFNPAYDMAELPRFTATIYQTDDEANQDAGSCRPCSDI